MSPKVPASLSSRFISGRRTMIGTWCSSRQPGRNNYASYALLLALPWAWKLRPELISGVTADFKYPGERIAIGGLYLYPKRIQFNGVEPVPRQTLEVTLDRCQYLFLAVTCATDHRIVLHRLRLRGTFDPGIVGVRRRQCKLTPE